MDIIDPFDAMQVCVSKCPTEDIKTREQLAKFVEDTDSNLCRYGITVEDIRTNLRDKDFDKEGPCPEFPIYARYTYDMSYLFNIMSQV